MKYVATNAELHIQIESIMAATDEGDFKWKCLVCEKKDRKKTYMARHMISHIEGIVHMCNKCGKASRTSNDLQTHISSTFHRNSDSQTKVPTLDFIGQMNKNNESKSTGSSNTNADNSENKGKTESNGSVETKQKDKPTEPEQLEHPDESDIFERSESDQSDQFDDSESDQGDPPEMPESE